MSTYDTITFEHSNRIALVTINRPDSLNALNQQVMAEVADVFARIDRDKDIAVSPAQWQVFFGLFFYLSFSLL